MKRVNIPMEILKNTIHDTLAACIDDDATYESTYNLLFDKIDELDAAFKDCLEDPCKVESEDE